MAIKANSIIRTLYLYLFALLGLVFIAIGMIRFLDMGLRATIFRQADAFERYEQPPMPFVTRMGDVDQLAAKAELTEGEKNALKQSLRDYEQWAEQRRNIDMVTVRRHRDASTSLAMMLVGLPLYLYHWRTIRREAEERKRRRATAPESA